MIKPGQGDFHNLSSVVYVTKTVAEFTSFLCPLMIVSPFEKYESTAVYRHDIPDRSVISENHRLKDAYQS